jgi:hypothetical protein
MGPKSKESKVEQRLVSIDDSWWVQLGAKTAFQLGGDCDRQATPKPPARCLLGKFSSCVAQERERSIASRATRQTFAFAVLV